MPRRCINCNERVFKDVTHDCKNVKIKSRTQDGVYYETGKYITGQNYIEIGRDLTYRITDWDIINMARELGMDIVRGEK